MPFFDVNGAAYLPRLYLNLDSLLVISGSGWFGAPPLSLPVRGGGVPGFRIWARRSDILLASSDAGWTQALDPSAKVRSLTHLFPWQYLCMQ
jgi:hypothetical protein